MRRVAAVIAAGGCIALASGGLASADPPLQAMVTSYATNGAPTQITAGPDGNPWFLDFASDSVSDDIGTVTSGKVVEYLAGSPSPRSTTAEPPTAITSGVAGTASAGPLWFTYRAGDFGGLGQITTAGAITGGTTLPYNPAGIAADANGNLWIAFGTGENAIYELQPPYTTPTPASPELPANANPASIVEGPDGQTMWFTEPGSGGDMIGSVDQNDNVTQYPVPVVGTLGNIVVGPDGNLWTGSVGVSPNPSAVLRITPQGVVTEFDLPAGSANPDVLAAGPDGELWMADDPSPVVVAAGPAGGLAAADASNPDGGLTAVSTSGIFTTYPGILPAGDRITSIVKDPGGADALWLTDETANAIYKVPLQPPPTTTTPPPTTAPPAQVVTPTPPTLTAALTPVATVTKSGATLSGTISAPTGSPPTALTYQFQYGTSTAYGSSTPSAATTATSAGVAVSGPLSALTPYTTYHYRLVASDCAAASCQTVTPDQTFTTGSTLQPLLDTSVGVTPTQGHVLIRLHGTHHFVALAVGELIPLGATIDARHGTVLIQSATADAPGEVASGLFSAGTFVVTQPPGSTITVLVLASSFKACVAKPLAHVATTAAKHKPSKKVVNQVFGNAHGQFSTRGHYATAADQGTGWRTADRCDGTLVAVSAGHVTVTDLVRHRAFILMAGHRYLARTR